MNPATPVLLEQLRGSSARAPKLKGRPLQDEAEEKLCRRDFADSGELGLPADNLLSCLIAAGRQVKYGRSNLSTATSSIVPGLLMIQEDFLPFIGEPAWKPDLRKGTNPHGGEAVAIVRPRFNSWGFVVTFDIEPELHADTAQELLGKAGRFIGLGDFRPQRRGRFGRFRITDWTLLDKPAPAKKAAKAAKRTVTP